MNKEMMQAALKMTPEDIEREIKMICMQEGVVVPVQPVAPEKIKMPDNDRVTFRVNIKYQSARYNWTHDDSVCFNNLESAKAFMDSPLVKIEDYEGRQVVVPIVDMNIQQVHALDYGTFCNYKMNIDSMAKDKERYDTELKTYKEAQKAYEEVVERITDRKAEAESFNRTALTIVNKLDEYISMAGATTVAIKFLRKIYSPDSIINALEWVGREVDAELVSQMVQDNEL